MKTLASLRRMFRAAPTQPEPVPVSMLDQCFGRAGSGKSITQMFSVLDRMGVSDDVWLLAPTVLPFKHERS
jgi:hypothetical protein